MCVDMQMLLLNICLVTCYARLWIVNKITISLKLKVLKLTQTHSTQFTNGVFGLFCSINLNTSIQS